MSFFISKKLTTLAGGALLASAASSSAATLSLDISGTPSFDAQGDPSNTVLVIDLASALGGSPGDPVSITGYGFDVNQTAGLDTGGASWLSEMTISVDINGDLTSDLNIQPSLTEAPGVESNTSGGIVPFSGFAPTGSISIEFWESFVDEADVQEGIWDAGSFLSIEANLTVPEPSVSLLLASFSGFLLLRRRRG